MWKERTCPICGKEMQIEYGADYEPVYMLRCPTQLELPTGMVRPKFGIKGDFVKSHFESQYEHDEPEYECYKLYPFIIQSYNNASNIYVLDQRLNRHFVAETPYLELPWNDLDKVIKKLKTYTVFS